MLTAPKINSFNSFDKPDLIQPVAFKDFRLSGGKLSAKLPPKSVVVLEVE